MRRQALLIALLLLGAIAISGCGGSSSPGSSSSEATTTQPAPQNAEEDVEAYGEEAKGSDREALLSAFHSYFGSIAKEDDQKTCELLSARVNESLESLAAKAKRRFSCAQLLGALLSPRAKQIATAQAQGEIRKIRIKGSTAFLIFHAPGARLYELSMVEEEGKWKAATLSASLLAP